MIGSHTASAERRDTRPPSVRFQDAAILEYAVRNRLVRGRVPEGWNGGDRDNGNRSSERTRRPPRKRSAWASARAEGIYRHIAPPYQKYPLRAVVLIRRMLADGAPDELVREKYRTHLRDCEEIGVLPMPLIPYLTQLLEVHRVDAITARRIRAIAESSVP